MLLLDGANEPRPRLGHLAAHRVTLPRAPMPRVERTASPAWYRTPEEALRRGASTGGGSEATSGAEYEYRVVRPSSSSPRGCFACFPRGARREDRAMARDPVARAPRPDLEGRVERATRVADASLDAVRAELARAEAALEAALEARDRLLERRLETARVSAAAATLRERLDGFEDYLPPPSTLASGTRQDPEPRVSFGGVVDVVERALEPVRAFCASRAPPEEAPSTCFDDYSR